MLGFIACSSPFSNAGGSTTDAAGEQIHVGGLQTYRYWADSDPTLRKSRGVERTILVIGSFHQEYIMYLEMKTIWAMEFAVENRLHRATTEPALPENAPVWFDPPRNFEVWTGSQGSLYFIDPESGHICTYTKYSFDGMSIRTIPKE
ncbi:MAG: hypothetical protein IPI91_19360 [Flavobacteriales bacterium]|nr:hypothetical protein [Flavobacteriales bacterium]